MEPKRFITVFTRIRYRSQSSARCIYSTPSHPITFRSTLILSSHLRLGLPIGVFSSGFPTKILYAFLTSHPYYMPRSSDPPSFHHPSDIWWSVQVMKLLIVLPVPASCHFLPFRTKYSPQHPVIKHPHSMIFLQCERPSFTPIQNNG